MGSAPLRQPGYPTAIYFHNSALLWRNIFHRVITPRRHYKTLRDRFVAPRACEDGWGPRLFIRCGTERLFTKERVLRLKDKRRRKRQTLSSHKANNQSVEWRRPLTRNYWPNWDFLWSGCGGVEGQISWQPQHVLTMRQSQIFVLQLQTIWFHLQQNPVGILLTSLSDNHMAAFPNIRSSIHSNWLSTPTELH